MKEILTEELRN